MGPTVVRNHCCYEVKKGGMMPRHQRSSATSSGHVSQLPNVDSEEEEKDDKENDGDENEGNDTNKSEEEDD